MQTWTIALFNLDYVTWPLPLCELCNIWVYHDAHIFCHKLRRRCHPRKSRTSGIPVKRTPVIVSVYYWMKWDYGWPWSGCYLGQILEPSYTPLWEHHGRFPQGLSGTSPPWPSCRPSLAPWRTCSRPPAHTSPPAHSRTSCRGRPRSGRWACGTQACRPPCARSGKLSFSQHGTHLKNVTYLLHTLSNQHHAITNNNNCLRTHQLMWFYKSIIKTIIVLGYKY